MTNRNPVPAAMASSRWVTPSDRRVLLTVLPISSTDTSYPPQEMMLPVGNISCLQDETQPNVTAREHQ